MKPDDLNILLTCKACSGSVAALADKCPHCGAPNDWRHPKIEAFYKDLANIGTAQPFSVWCNKTSVWGETAAKPALWAQIFFGLSLVVAALLSLVFSWWIVFVTAFVGGIVMATVQTKKSFRADLAAETWASNDNEFWRPVIERLRP